MQKRSIPPGRLIPYQTCGGAENMAIDQMLLESVEASGQPTLRLYGWNEPTLSLGYFQSREDRQAHSSSRPLRMVRRATGGGAIVHHHELTYSIAVPLGSLSIGANRELYDKVHSAMIHALGDFGIAATTVGQSGYHSAVNSPFLCFMRRTNNDLVVSGYKVLGSAQRKSRRAVLQHGSLLLRASEFAPELPGVADLTGRSLAIDEIVGCFSAHVRKGIFPESESDVTWEHAGLIESERQRASKISESRFGSTNWTDRR